MPRSIPTNPSVRFLQKEAKDILNTHKAGNKSCCPTLRYHFRFSRASDADILGAKLTLQEVQHALALDYGFKSWKELKGKVEAESTTNAPPTQPDKIIAEMIRIAVKERASDVHIEPMTNDVRVRYRVDGVLYEMKPISRDEGSAVVEQIMSMCELDLGAKDRPQDGRMMLNIEGRQVDIRANVSPVIHGSVVAMRLLDKTAVSFSLDDLCMEPDQLELYKVQVHAAQGTILVVGPAGCGKTTTIYGSLMELNDTRRKIMTIEDPVEFAIEGIDQMAVRPEAGLGFEQAIRSILRQAPNVIMAGEVRSPEVANLVVQASLSGHVVFSTLHTNDCAGTFIRLINMGVEPWLVADSVRCVVAQRLVREICKDCKMEHKPELGEFASLQLTDEERDLPLYRGAGCEKCNQVGYKGRGAIYSIMPMTPAVARQVEQKETEAIESAARAEGWTSLREAAIRKMFRGETTAEEVLKFT
jgi:type IV pilus assembly protein PilB